MCRTYCIILSNSKVVISSNVVKKRSSQMKEKKRKRKTSSQVSMILSALIARAFYVLKWVCLPPWGAKERSISTGTDLRTFAHACSKFRLFKRIKPRSLVAFNRKTTAVSRICQQQWVDFPQTTAHQSSLKGRRDLRSRNPLPRLQQRRPFSMIRKYCLFSCPNI